MWSVFLKPTAMANPALLFQRTRDAIKSNDLQSFLRWTRHPRWRVSPEWAPEWAHAALRSPDTTEWFERLEGLGVSLTQGYRSPLLCEAARLNNVKAVRWLLDNGADVDAASDFGLGVTPGHYALQAQSADAMEMLWEHTNRMWSLVGPSRHSVWFRPESLQMLEQMTRRGWSPDHPEVSPSNPEGQSFRQWCANQQDQVSTALLSWMESVRLGGVIQSPSGHSSPGEVIKPRSRL